MNTETYELLGMRVCRSCGLICGCPIQHEKCKSCGSPFETNGLEHDIGGEG